MQDENAPLTGRFLLADLFTKTFEIAIFVVIIINSQ